MKDKKIEPQKEIKPSRTKGYYTFKKDYPSDMVPDAPFAVKSEKMNIQTRIIISVISVILFITVFIGSSVIMNLSDRKPKAEIIGTGDTAAVSEPVTS